MFFVLFLSIFVVVPVSGDGLLNNILKDAEDDSSLPKSVFSCFYRNNENDCIGGDCMWCKLGGNSGMCFEEGFAHVVNAAEMPHLKCSNEKQTGEMDEEFWPNTIDCLMHSSTPSICTENPACSWCSIHPTDLDIPYDDETMMELRDVPRFGLCISDNFMDEIDSLLPEDEETTELKNSGECGIDAASDPGLFESRCTELTSLGPTVCKSSKEGCVWMNVFGHTNVCLTKVQSDVVTSVEKLSGPLNTITHAARRKK